MTPRYFGPIAIGLLTYILLNGAYSFWHFQQVLGGLDLAGLQALPATNAGLSPGISALVFITTGLACAWSFSAINGRLLTLEERLMLALFVAIILFFFGIAQIALTLVLLGMPPELIGTIMVGTAQFAAHFLPAWLLMGALVLTLVICFGLLLLGMKLGSPKGANPGAFLPD